MRKALLKFLLIYLVFIAFFVVMKPIFMTVYNAEINASAADWFAVIFHGLKMDCSVAGYLTIIPGLLLIASLIFPAKGLTKALDIYMAVIAALLSFIFCLDLGLYGSWGFRLDMTPFFYITTSPASAIASLAWWHWLAALIGIPAVALLIWAVYSLTARRIKVTPTGWGAPIGMLLVTAALIIPIRGSLTVSTMNLSQVYFSENQRLNHAAINPAFSLLYSSTHQTDFDSQYTFLSDSEAATILASQYLSSPASGLPEAPSLLCSRSEARASSESSRPDIVLVILESFSAHLLPSLGGQPIALGLDSIARDGILFTNFYASSFRTDRGLAAILSSFPAPPSTSLLKYVEKFENLPSLPSILKQNGYTNAYYYGGDANFTNMQAYLVSSGFSKIISDKDFPIADRTSKWGAHDEKVFTRALADLTAEQKAATQIAAAKRKPSFTVIQTSSSHEPFEVPYANPRFAANPRQNAFAYTDSCLTDFINALQKQPNWKNTLVVILPDHYGCWPENIESAPERHHIPLVFTGGALASRGFTIDKLACQTDLGATLLTMLGISPSPLRYSRNIFATTTPPMAIFTEPSLTAVVTPTDTLVYNPDADAIISSTSPAATNLPLARAFLRNLYSTLSNL
jgi:phosphoglycerol transferase MdoB-like AlkP superfamily enzyme